MKNGKNIAALVAGGVAGFLVDKLAKNNPKKGVFAGAVGATIATATNQSQAALVAQGFGLYNLSRLAMPPKTQITLGRVRNPVQKETAEPEAGKKVKVYFSPWFEPYREGENGKLRTNFFEHIKPGRAGKYAEAGLYFIRDVDNGDIVYIGRSEQDLYNRLYRHFQKHHARYATHTYPKWGYEVQVLQVDPANEKYIPGLERYYILRENPRDNIEKLELFNQENDWEGIDSSGFDPPEDTPF